MPWTYWDQVFSESSDPWAELLGETRHDQPDGYALLTQERMRRQARLRLMQPEEQPEQPARPQTSARKVKRWKKRSK